jgi:hypothetical protein
MPLLLMHKEFTIWKRAYMINYFDEYINEGFHYIFMTVFLLIDYEVDLDDDNANEYVVFSNFDFEKLKVLT